MAPADRLSVLKERDGRQRCERGLRSVSESCDKPIMSAEEAAIRFAHSSVLGAVEGRSRTVGRIGWQTAEAYAWGSRGVAGGMLSSGSEERKDDRPASGDSGGNTLYRLGSRSIEPGQGTHEGGNPEHVATGCTTRSGGKI